MAESRLPGVVDHHVHLGLVDHDLLAGGAVVRVHDLGWDPDLVGALRPAGVEVRAVGPFHTAVGGYPAGRPWAPAGAVRQLAAVEDAVAAVEDVEARGLSGFKIALHAGMPLLSDEVLATAVRAAQAAGLPVLVHAEGPGQVERAVDVRADVLVHAPWTERVPDDVLRRGRAMTWISTLAIHAGYGNVRMATRRARPSVRSRIPGDSPALATAVDNVRRFRALGGRVVYGTDMGNGPTPVGVNADEIRLLELAGMTGEDLIGAVCTGATTLTSPHPRPTDAADLVTWLADAHRVGANPVPSRREPSAEIDEGDR